VIGDHADFVGRLKAALPSRWFPVGATPILDALLGGLASAWVSIYALLQYVILQTRIATATDRNLDYIAGDFFGLDLPRLAGERDASYSLRIRAEMFRPRGTRAAVIRALTDLTGRARHVFEPANTDDTGGYRAGGVGYGVAGGYGSLLLPFQFFVVAYRPVTGGIPQAAGYGSAAGWAATGAAGIVSPVGAYGGGVTEYGSLSLETGVITDAVIYAAINAVRPAASIAWTRISN
jgi:hypothetical protein